MRLNKFALLLGLAITWALFSEVAAHADQVDQSTKMTFSAPVQIPGRVLPAGTYVFKLAEFPDSSDLNIVQIFHADGTHLIATMQTVPTQRLQTAGDTVVTLAQQPNGPEALVKWFFPGQNTGHEFMYSKQEAQQIAQDQQLTIEAKEAAQSGD